MGNNKYESTKFGIMSYSKGANGRRHEKKQGTKGYLKYSHHKQVLLYGLLLFLCFDPDLYFFCLLVLFIAKFGFRGFREKLINYVSFSFSFFFFSLRLSSWAYFVYLFRYWAGVGCAHSGRAGAG